MSTILTICFQCCVRLAENVTDNSANNKIRKMKVRQLKYVFFQSSLNIINHLKGTTLFYFCFLTRVIFARVRNYFCPYICFIKVWDKVLVKLVKALVKNVFLTMKNLFYALNTVPGYSVEFLFGSNTGVVSILVPATLKYFDYVKSVTPQPFEIVCNISL